MKGWAIALVAIVALSCGGAAALGANWVLERRGAGGETEQLEKELADVKEANSALAKRLKALEGGAAKEDEAAHEEDDRQEDAESEEPDRKDTLGAAQSFLDGMGETPGGGQIVEVQDGRVKKDDEVEAFWLDPPRKIRATTARIQIKVSYPDGEEQEEAFLVFDAGEQKWSWFD